jgi:Na+(H+)/acetate symporter ActP
MDNIFYSVGNVVCSGLDLASWFSLYNRACVLNIGGFGGMNVPNYVQVGQYTLVIVAVIVAVGFFELRSATKK